MTRIIEAIYENGVFKPTKKVKLPEHERFKLVISSIDENELEIKKLVGKQKHALKNLIGIGSSDTDDGSVGHDKYLYERD